LHKPHFLVAKIVNSAGRQGKIFIYQTVGMAVSGDD